MVTAFETDLVGLEPVPEPGLHDADAALDLGDQPVEVVPLLFLEVAHAGGHDACQEDRAEAGRRIGGQPELTEGEAPSWCNGPRVPDLQLGEQHGGPR